ncbi:MAG: adenosylcobinamide-phosphate synthase CbiB [Bauldia sp.]
MSIVLAFLAMTVDLAIGYPSPVYRAIGHPVTWIGRLVNLLDQRLNRGGASDRARRVAGAVALVVIVGAAGLVGWLIQYLLGNGWIALVFLAFLASSLIAQRSLAAHVTAVATALESGGLGAGRRAVAEIVGRDPQSLDEAGVSRAAIESLSENFSDGVVAPLFWMAVAGLPGAAAYKAANTADSMIGHRTPRHLAFGWAAARFDDLVNLPASRLSALLILAAACFVRGASPATAWAAIRRDASRHRSPNAGYPEAAMAGALGLALAGQRSYSGVIVDDALMGEGGRREATAADIRRALQLFWLADFIFLALLGVLAALVIALR